MSKLIGKVAIVTGASKGIGAGIARAFGAAGARVVVNYATSKADADRVVAEIVAHDGKAVAVQADVSKLDDIRRLFAETRKAFGAVDILVNNAGVYHFAPLEEVSEAEFHRQFNTNVLGPILTVQESLKHFGPAGGNIINVGSVVAENPPPGSVIYAATKGALNTITRELSRELAARNIRVNSLNPGGTETEGFITAGVKGSAFEKSIVDHTPLGRLGRPDDMARAAVFLASADSAWITGELLNVAGGYR